jgi:hypothetical protein
MYALKSVGEICRHFESIGRAVIAKGLMIPSYRPEVAPTWAAFRFVGSVRLLRFGSMAFISAERYPGLYRFLQAGQALVGGGVPHRKAEGSTA